MWNYSHRVTFFVLGENITFCQAPQQYWYYSTLDTGIKKEWELSWGNWVNLDEILIIVNKWHPQLSISIRHKKKDSFNGQVCVFVCLCICVWSQCFVRFKFVSTLWDSWAIAINCMANADNHETGSCEFSTLPMVALDAHQSCTSAGMLQAL